MFIAAAPVVSSSEGTKIISAALLCGWICSFCILCLWEDVSHLVGLKTFTVSYGINGNRETVLHILKWRETVTPSVKERSWSNETSWDEDVLLCLTSKIRLILTFSDLRIWGGRYFLGKSELFLCNLIGHCTHETHGLTGVISQVRLKCHTWFLKHRWRDYFTDQQVETMWKILRYINSAYSFTYKRFGVQIPGSRA